jgi:murein DD-endopeptidase MepM/ murein hydrolase activator NlpD
LHLPVAADAQGVPKVIYRYFDLDPDVGEIIDWRGGQVTYDGHTGTDYDWPPESEVRAARGGTVTAARNDCPDLPDPDGGYGNYVKILHDAFDDGSMCYTLCGHMMNGSVTWQPDDEVVPGSLLGLEGQSGNATGYHVHAEVGLSEGNIPVCPYQQGWIEGPLEFAQQ